jgi:hypothetical protein
MELVLVAMNGHQRAIGSTNFSGESRERIKGFNSVRLGSFVVPLLAWIESRCCTIYGLP